MQFKDSLGSKLVPIRVGMILLYIILMCQVIACPHTRGDDPVRVTASNFEPKLVPIRVGMILQSDK